MLRSKRAQSFSGSLAQFLAEQLFSSTRSPHLLIETGSEILVTGNGSAPSLTAPQTPEIIYWGGSTRSDSVLDPDALEMPEVLAVRGPVSAAALSLPQTVPQGDIILFLPAFYKPQGHSLTEGKTVFIPDENDKRSDSAFTSAACDIILRPAISHSRDSLFELVDAIVAAKFILTASLPAALVAAAYGRPFAYWAKAEDTDKTAWKDFTAFLGLPLVSANNVRTAQTHYAEALNAKPPASPSPSLSAFLACAPFAIKPEGLLAFLDNEVRKRGNNSTSHTIEAMMRSFARHRTDLESLAPALPAEPEKSVPVSSAREFELLELVKTLEDKNRDSEIREQNLLRSVQILGEKISVTRPKRANSKLGAKVSNEDIAEFQGQILDQQTLIADLEKKLNSALNAAQFENTLITRQLAETQSALADAQSRYRKIHNSRTWSLVRKSRKMRQSLSPKALIRKMRQLLPSTKPASEAPRTPKPAPAKGLASTKDTPSELAIVIADTGAAVSPEAQQRIKDWVGQGYDVTVCGKARHWNKLGASVIPCNAAGIVQAVNHTITDTHSAFVLVVTSPEHTVQGLEHIKAGFVNFEKLAVVSAVENHAGKVHAAGGILKDGQIVPQHQDEKSGASSVTRLIPTPVLWPSVVAVDQDSFVHLKALPPAASLEEALVAFGAQARAHGLEIAVNGLLTTEQPSPRNTITVASELIDPQHAQPLQERPWVLFTDGGTPTPDKDSGSIDLCWFLKIFRALGYQIAFLPYHQRDHAGPYTDKLRLLGIETLQSDDVAEPWLHLRDHGARYDVALVYRVTTAAYILEPIRTFAPDAKIIFDTVDLHFLREEMAAKKSGAVADLENAKATRAQELAAMQASDATILLSASEDVLIGKLLPKVRRKLISLVRHIPGRTRGAEGRKDAIFVGGFLHRPNVDAALYLCKDIWPAVRRLDPAISVHIIGADAPEEILQLHNPAQGIHVIGRVPTLDKYYDTARINLAPLTFGAGVKGKVAASLSVGLPTVGTSVATDGMWLTHEKDVLVADTPEDFAKNVVKLHQNDKLWEKLSLNGIETARKHFSVETARARLKDLLGELGLKPPTH